MLDWVPITNTRFARKEALLKQSAGYLLLTCKLQQGCNLRARIIERDQSVLGRTGLTGDHLLITHTQLITQNHSHYHTHTITHTHTHTHTHTQSYP